jgi:serine/threonine-protein kinase RsbW
MGREPSVSGGARYVMNTPEAGRAVLRFASGHGHVSSALDDIATFLGREGVPRGVVEDTTIALAEALNNIEEHAYGGLPDLPVQLCIVAGDHCVRCEIEDRGTPLPGGSLPAGSMPTTDPVALEKWPEGGFGWALLRRLTSELTYQRRCEWNRLRFAVS